ncbi:hypothetical protein L2E82_11729 [Cichorium intybus]|uniref:Uncharacterized protein n=1 Tax=Cichorium intybus TaxID=13427 RepID=A0ACB9GG35_CICIN|nr:hypothetical protein L2E82_11729 [Cichorium intybus]
MSDGGGLKRKSTRTAAIEAAKRIKNNADANKLLSRGINKEYEFDEAQMVTPFIIATTNDGFNCIASNNTHRRKSHKGKMLDQVHDSTNCPLKGQLVHDLSKKVTKLVKGNPPKSKDMPKRGRGRPPKAQSAKYLFTSNTFSKYEDIYDVNERRESYNTSILKSEPSSAKQLQPVNGGISYRESLMKFCKDLGPTARQIARRKLLAQDLNYQPRRLLEPLLASSQTQPNPCFLDVSSFHGSARNTNSNQLSQPLITFGASRTDATEDNKGKTIMVDDGKSNFNKWDTGENLQFSFGKQKSGVKIFNRYQENVSLTGGDGSSENDQDFFRKNLGHVPVGNWRTINNIGSFLSNYDGNLNRNINNNYRIEDSEVNPRKRMNSCVYPSTYVQPSRNVSSSLLGLDDGMSSAPWVPTPLAPVPPLQKWCLPPPETKNPVISDGLWREKELQLALASYMQMTDQNSKAWFGNSLVQNQFMQPDPHGTYQQQAGDVQSQQHQFLSYQNIFDSDVSQPHDGLLMSMAPQLWSQMAMNGSTPKQDS